MTAGNVCQAAFHSNLFWRRFRHVAFLLLFLGHAREK
jgi:hypothetical protein